jgi:hypothetical protein
MNSGGGAISHGWRVAIQERKELRTSGIISGLKAAVTLGISTYVVDLDGGVCYINGKRIEVPSVQDYITDIEYSSVDKIYVGLDRFGSISVQPGDGLTCLSNISSDGGCLLATAEYDGTNISTIDMRLFIDSLDLKLLNSIKVSNVYGMGHFNNIPDAIKFAKRFRQVYPKAEIPKIDIKAGYYLIEHDIDLQLDYATWSGELVGVDQNLPLSILYNKLFDDGIFIDFPIIIEGEGTSTEIEIKINCNFTDISYTFIGFIPIVAETFTAIERSFNGIYTDGTGNGLVGNVIFKNLKLINTRLEVINIGAIVNSKIMLHNLYFDFRSFIYI